MSSIHEFDVALSIGVPAHATAARQTAREVHLNVWTAGFKALSPAFIGDSTLTPTIGLTLAGNRSNSPALVNAPSELVLGDTAAAPAIVNLTELFAESNAAVSPVFTGFGIP